MKNLLKGLAGTANSFKDDKNELSLLNHPYAIYQGEKSFKGFTSFLRISINARKFLEKINE